MNVEQSPDELPEAELVHRCLERPVDEDAWNIFYNRYYDFVRGIVYRTSGGSSQEIADFTQDGFTKIFSTLCLYDPKKAGLRTYISHIVRNVVIDRLRHGREVRENSGSLETELGLFQLQAARDPQLTLAVAALIVDRQADSRTVGIVEDLVNGKPVKEICQYRQVKSGKVYEIGRWFREVLSDATRARSL